MTRDDHGRAGTHPSAASTAPPPLRGVGGLLDAARGTVVTGRSFDEGHDARGDRVAVLGARVAERLGIARVDRQPSIFIGIAYAVIGVVDEMQRRPDLKDAVIGAGWSRPERLRSRQRRGTAGADRAGVERRSAGRRRSPWIRDSPENFDVIAPSSGSELMLMQADVNVVFLILGSRSPGGRDWGIEQDQSCPPPKKKKRQIAGAPSSSRSVWPAQGFRCRSST